MNDREVRCLMAGVELRAATDSKGPGTITGYAAVFDKFSQDLGNFREKIAPGAFARALVKSDVRALVNHDPNLLIGRTKAGTMRLREDSLGLRAEIDLPDTQLGRDTAESIRRGDMDGMSFAFTMPSDDDADDWDWSGDVPVRTIRSVDELFDCCPVTYPAYPDTSAAMRSLDRCKNKQEPTPTDPEPTPATAPEGDEVRDFLDSAKARLRLAEATLS